MAYILINAGAKSIEDWIKFLEEQKQNLLTAGSNITIDENGVISATTGTTYEAGTGIDIIGNTIAIDSSILTQLGLINMKVDIHYTDEEYVNQYIQNDSSHFRLIRTNSNTDKNSAFEITESGVEATYDYSSTIKYVLSLKLGASLEAYYNNTKMSEIVASEDGNCYMICKDDTDDYIDINQYQTTVSHKDSNIIKAGTYWLRIDSTNGIQWSDDSGTTWNNYISQHKKHYEHVIRVEFSNNGTYSGSGILKIINDSSDFFTTDTLKTYLSSITYGSGGRVPYLDISGFLIDSNSKHKPMEFAYITSGLVVIYFINDSFTEDSTSFTINTLISVNTDKPYPID